MSILMSGAEWPEFYSDKGGQNFTQSTGYYDQRYSRCALNLVDNTDIAYLDLPTTMPTAVWFHLHFRLYDLTEYYFKGVAEFGLYDANGNMLAGLEYNNNSDASKNFSPCYLSGGTRVSTTDYMNYATDVEYNIDFFVDSANGVIKVYKDDSLVVEYNGLTIDDLSNAKTFRIVKHHQLYFSQVIIADESTIGMVLATIAPDSAGTHQDWTGSYTDVDEIGNVDLSDFIYTDTINSSETFSFSNLDTSLDGYGIREVKLVSSVRKASGSSINNLRHLCRPTSTDYESADLNPPGDSSVVERHTVYTTNPETGSNWTRTEVDSAEFGIKTT